MKKSVKPLSFSLPFEQKPENDVQVQAFLFSRNGKLLERANAGKDGLQFKTAIERPDEVRVILAPANENIPSRLTPEVLLTRFNGYESMLKRNPNQSFYIRPIPAQISRFWFPFRCHVRGNVFKNFTIHELSGNRPICNARVHICEVDPIRLIIDRIPDKIIRLIPELVLHPEIPIPVPEPEPGPFPVPDPGPLRFNPKNVFSATQTRALALNKLEEVAFMSQHLGGNTLVASAVQSRSLTQIRSALAENFHLFHPIFCHIKWLWPYFYSCQELAVVQTDMNGNFDTDIYYWPWSDRPDLYFWVEVQIDGVWTTVYRPSKACHTWWNYACGTRVNIEITDPRVQWGCQEIIPGEVVWVKTVGHGASVSHIQQSNATGAAIQGVLMNRVGLTDHIKGSGDFRSPFGSQLYFIVQFGSGLPGGRYHYYRWSFQKVLNQDLSPTIQPVVAFNNAVSKSYTFEYTDVTGTHFDARSVPLGPLTVGTQRNLYLIPPASPYAAPVNATETAAFWDQNTMSILFDSASLQGDGLYEMTLELFDSAGNKISDIPNNLFQVPDYNSFTPSVNAPAANLDASGPGVCEAFKMLMRVDNSKCEAQVYKVRVNGVESSPNCCGFVKYAAGDDVELSFRAYHDTNFADFSFTVQKGTCNDPAQSGLTNAAGMVIADAGGYTRDGASIYRKEFTPAQLLGTCAAEGKAAFAEHLYLTALATNGNDRLAHLDASDLAAFALEPV